VTSRPGKRTVVRDAVHGDIELTAEECRVLDTPQMQRLRGVRQLGTAYLVFPSAQHTRFEHSIGTLHLASEMLKAVDESAAGEPTTLRRIAPEELRIARIAALVHDVTHIPFGHHIEDQTGMLARHDTEPRIRAMLGETDLGRVLRELGVADEVLAALLPGKAGGAVVPGAVVPEFLHQVISDTICSDILDYLQRDAYFTGLKLTTDQRILRYFKVEKTGGRLFVDCEKRGMIREDIVSEILRTLEARYYFSERVYYHHAKVAAGTLVARALEIAFRAGAIREADLVDKTDHSLLEFLRRLDPGEGAMAAKFHRYLAMFERRALPKRAAVLPYYMNIDLQAPLVQQYFAPGAQPRRIAWETERERECRERFGRDIDVILDCPKREMQLKEARTLVRFPGSGERILPLNLFRNEIPRIADLEESYRRLWKLYVFVCDPDPQVRKFVQERALAALPGARNGLAV
jgi:HD superfamily phosphohydrolase